MFSSSCREEKACSDAFCFIEAALRLCRAREDLLPSALCLLEKAQADRAAWGEPLTRRYLAFLSELADQEAGWSGPIELRFETLLVSFLDRPEGACLFKRFAARHPLSSPRLCG